MHHSINRSQRRLLYLVSVLMSVSLTASCGTLGSVSGLEKPDLATIPQALKEPCADVSTKPANISYAQVITLWQSDRDVARTCKRRHQSLATAVDIRDGIQGR